MVRIGFASALYEAAESESPVNISVEVLDGMIEDSISLVVNTAIGTASCKHSKLAHT